MKPVSQEGCDVQDIKEIPQTVGGSDGVANLLLSDIIAFFKTGSVMSSVMSLRKRALYVCVHIHAGVCVCVCVRIRAFRRLRL